VKRRLLLICAALLLAGCTGPGVMPGDAAPVVKIGLVAPFEGLGRPLGYAVLPAVKLAIAEANASGELGRYRVALVALNDDDDAAGAAAQGRALADDPDLLGVIGPFDSEPAGSAAAAYSSTGLPALVAAPLEATAPALQSLCPPPVALAEQAWQRAGAPGGGVAGPATVLAQALSAVAQAATLGASIRDGALLPQKVLYTGDAAGAADQVLRWHAAGWQGTLIGGPDLARPWFVGRAGPAGDGTLALACAPGESTPVGFDEAYRAQAGSLPGPDARLAYAGARRLLQAVAADIKAHGRPSRAGTGAALGARPGQARSTWLVVRNGQWIEAGQ
jgi:hypothetical protein